MVRFMANRWKKLASTSASCGRFFSASIPCPPARNGGNGGPARWKAWKAGGAIMVHGLPNTPRYPQDRYLATDWTDGCVALSNDDMLEFWLLTRSDIPIDIYP